MVLATQQDPYLNILRENKNLLASCDLHLIMDESPGALLTYYNDGGGGGPSVFFGSEILAKSDFFGSMKDTRIFLGREEKQRDFFRL